MIIFTPIKDIPVELLEYKEVTNVIKYNLSSYYVGFPQLNMLIPSIQYIPEEILNGDCSDASFDTAYHNYIMQNDAAFMQFMNIMAAEFTIPGVLIQILIEISEYRDIISESLMKLIQQRYGHNSYYVYTEEDFLYTEIQDFSIPGLFALDQDLNRWRLMNPDLGSELHE